MEPARGCNQNVGLAGNGRHIRRACVTVDNCRIFVHEHHGDRPTYHEGTADDGGLFTADRNVEMVQDLHGCLCGTGRKSGLCVGENTCKREIRTAVNILGGIEHLPCFLAVKVSGKRPEEKDAVNRIILIDAGELPVEGPLGRVLGKNDIDHLDSDSLGAFGRTALIGQVIRALPNPENAQCRGDSLFPELFNIPLHF